MVTTLSKSHDKDRGEGAHRAAVGEFDCSEVFLVNLDPNASNTGQGPESYLNHNGIML